MKQHLLELERSVLSQASDWNARNVVREYLQARILEGLVRARAMASLAFLGGTAFRCLPASHWRPAGRYDERCQSKSTYRFRLWDERLQPTRQHAVTLFPKQSQLVGVQDHGYTPMKRGIFITSEVWGSGMVSTKRSNDGRTLPTEELHFATANELLELYAHKTLSPVEVAESLLARIDTLNPRLNCFVFVDAERTLRDARASEVRWRKGNRLGALDGVPVSVKDLLLTEGWPTRKGSLTVPANGGWDEDAPAVARLREHGAVLLGKTSTPEYGHKGTTSSILCGVTRNPWNPEVTPGGSSGGAGAAVAGGMGPLALGTDGGGSVRIPSSFSGLFGHKPSFGRVPAWPLSLFGTVANVGPMARTVADGALLFEVITEPDHRDFHALPADNTDYRAAAMAGAKGLRIGYTPDFGMLHAMGGQDLDPSVVTITRNAADALRRAGADVKEISPEWPCDPARIFRLIWMMGAARLAGELSAGDYELLDPNLRSFCEEGKSYGLAEYYEAQHGREVRKRSVVP